MDKERLNNMIWWFCFLGMGLLCISLVIGSKAILEANLSDITQGDMSVFVSGTLLSLGIMFGLVLMFAWDGRALQKRLKALEEKQNGSSWIMDLGVPTKEIPRPYGYIKQKRCKICGRFGKEFNPNITGQPVCTSCVPSSGKVKKKCKK